VRAHDRFLLADSGVGGEALLPTQNAEHDRAPAVENKRGQSIDGATKLGSATSESCSGAWRLATATMVAARIASPQRTQRPAKPAATRPLEVPIDTTPPDVTQAIASQSTGIEGFPGNTVTLDACRERSGKGHRHADVTLNERTAPRPISEAPALQQCTFQLYGFSKRRHGFGACDHRGPTCPNGESDSFKEQRACC